MEMKAGMESSLEKISRQFADIVYNGVVRCIARYDLAITVKRYGNRSRTNEKRKK